MSTMYSRSLVMLEQSKSALAKVAVDDHNIYQSMNEAFLKVQEDNQK